MKIQTNNDAMFDANAAYSHSRKNFKHKGRPIKGDKYFFHSGRHFFLFG